MTGVAACEQVKIVKTECEIQKLVPHVEIQPGDMTDGCNGQPTIWLRSKEVDLILDLEVRGPRPIEK